MAVTLEHIKTILDDASIHYVEDEAHNMLHSHWQFSKEVDPLILLVVLLEDGEMLQLRVPRLLTITEDEHTSKIHRAMLDMAYQVRFVQFQYDPSDGEVSTCIDLPIEDGTVTERQVLASASVLLDVSTSARDRFRAIQNTGIDPALDIGETGEDEE